jgi:glycosyltransferase involved in cell wall biosynthesis
VQPLRLSLVICTYNPRADYLARVLDSLKFQKLPLPTWELVIVDNASQTPVAPFVDISWHPHGRVVREEKQGLTHARICGINSTCAPLILFIDDDNLLPSDYLENCLALEMEFPLIGVWGASLIAPEYEEKPAPELEPFCCILALRDIKKDTWSNQPVLSEFSPFGAGMLVRRKLAESYAADKKRSGFFFGRTGNSLLSSDDYEITLTAADSGFGYGVFERLKLTHLIPSRRVQREYILRMYEACAQSDLTLIIIRRQQAGEKVDLAFMLRRLLPPFYKMIIRKGLARSIFFRVLRGRWKALRMRHNVIGAMQNIPSSHVPDSVVAGLGGAQAG